MNIGLLTSSNPELRQRLAADVTDETPNPQAGAVADAPIAEPKPRPIVNVAPSTKFASLRATLDAQIAVDVATGQLSADDATAVHATLDAIDSRSRPNQSMPALQAAKRYLATIPPGTLIARFG